MQSCLPPPPTICAPPPQTCLLLLGSTSVDSGSQVCWVCVQGVLYSHRSNYLHAMIVASQDVIGLSSTSCFCAIVPLFHANSWGLVFAAPMTGARLVLPGQHSRSYRGGGGGGG